MDDEKIEEPELKYEESQPNEEELGDINDILSNDDDDDDDSKNKEEEQLSSTCYVSLQNINHSTSPRHRGKQKSFQSLATELTHYTRLSSRRSQITTITNTTLRTLKYSEIASIVSAYSSFIPQDHEDLLQIEYELDVETNKLNTRLLYGFNIILFIIFYILLFISSTKKYSEYFLLIISLSLSLIYTMIPSYILIPIPCLCENTGSLIDAESYSQRKKQSTFMVTVRKIRFPLDQSTIPVLCVLLLIISGNRNFSILTAWKSMKGDHIKPWSVLSILFGLCYLCITLDLTGILKGFATKTAELSGSYQTHLFFYIFVFAAILTIFTNNDISIICLTPLVCSTANSGNIDSTPFIFMVLFTSNTFSMLLTTGNPANLIVSQAAGLTYIKYLKYMAIPTIITGCILYIELYIMFRKKLRIRFQAKIGNDGNGNWKDLIKLPRYAIFCGIRLFLACIGIPIVGQLQENNKNLRNYPLDMFIVAGIAIISFIIDLMIFDIRRLAQFSSTDHINNDNLNQSLLDNNNNNKNENEIFSAPNKSLNAIDETHEDDDIPYVELSGIPSIETTPNNMNILHIQNTMDTRITHNTFQTYDSNKLLYDKLKLKIETFAIDALWELPWKLIPFVFSLFIIVGFMDNIGLVDCLANSLITISATNQWIAMFIVGGIATILCQCVNNQPMTVLLSTVLTRVKQHKPTPDWLNGAYFALAIGANLGGNGTPIASLAVLMWRGILAKWNIYMKYIGFSKRGIPITPLLLILCILLVAIEDLYIF